MSTTLVIPYTADAANVVIDGSHTYGPPAEIAKADFQTRDPVAWVAAQEFLNLGATSGNVTITAV